MITQTGIESELIYRQQAIDALDGELTITGRTNAEAVRGYVKLVKDRLERLPSAQPKRGKWNTHDVVKILASGKVLDGFMQCTACGCIFDDHSTEYYFCPNCGADMRGEQDE